MRHTKRSRIILWIAAVICVIALFHVLMHEPLIKALKFFGVIAIIIPTFIFFVKFVHKIGIMKNRILFALSVPLLVFLFQFSTISLFEISGMFEPICENKSELELTNCLHQKAARAKNPTLCEDIAKISHTGLSPRLLAAKKWDCMIEIARIKRDTSVCAAVANPFVLYYCQAAATDGTYFPSHREAIIESYASGGSSVSDRIALLEDDIMFLEKTVHKMQKF